MHFIVNASIRTVRLTPELKSTFHLKWLFKTCWPSLTYKVNNIHFQEEFIVVEVRGTQTNLIKSGTHSRIREASAKSPLQYIRLVSVWALVYLEAQSFVFLRQQQWHNTNQVCIFPKDT